MVVLGRGLFLMSEVPLYAGVTLPGGQVAGGASTRSSLGNALGSTGGAATNASRASNWTVQQVSLRNEIYQIFFYFY